MILWASIFSRVDSVDEVVVPFCPLEIKEGQVTQMAAVITQGHLEPGIYGGCSCGGRAPTQAKSQAKKELDPATSTSELCALS